MLNKHEVQYLISTCERAGQEILKSRDELKVSYKSDSSPVTQADINSNLVIMDTLVKFNLPIISEETYIKGDKVEHDKYWLIDPLDGTKEFIKGRDEFTVNIALMHLGSPVFGVVSAPAKNEVWVGINSGKKEAFKVDSSGNKFSINCRRPIVDSLVSLISMSHANKGNLAEFYQKNNLKVSHEIPAGSSLKICYVAEAEADIYPRLGPTMEWDVAAAHAVLEAAGGYMLNEDGDTICYGKPGLLNGCFIATGFKNKFRF